jgi:hypothetical protein
VIMFSKRSIAVAAILGAAGLAAAASGQSEKAKIDRALAAAPPDIAKNATVAEWDGKSEMKILRRGTNGFTCLPGDPDEPGHPALCANEAAMQWHRDFAAHKPKPTITVPGVEYMLAGATQRSDSDPNDKTSPPVQMGPHWMIMFPFDPATTGLPTTHAGTGAYIMWAGTPWAHLHIMGNPQHMGDMSMSGAMAGSNPLPHK